MSITGTIEEGKVIAQGEIPWPSGTVVRIEAAPDETPSLWETLKDFDGMARDLPEDLAANLDHYVHGHAKS